MVAKQFLKTQTITPFKPIDRFLFAFNNGMIALMGNRVVGIYLTGSLSYGSFKLGRSDIDLVVILKNSATGDEVAHIRDFHRKLEKQYPKWASRLECSYPPQSALKETRPPKEPRPWYYGEERHLYDKAPYGNEWLINNYFLVKYGIALSGPKFITLLPQVEFREVQKASLRDLFEEWEPKLENPKYLSNSHNQSYLVINLCRILYTVLAGVAGSKQEACEWAKGQFGEPWAGLISLSENWGYGKEMPCINQTRDFIRFSIKQVKNTNLYNELQGEISHVRDSKKEKK